MEFLKEPWKHQLEGFEKAKDLPWFGFFFDPGCGKTGTDINVLRYKMAEAKRYFRTIIFCPPAVVPNWKDEFGIHSKIPQKRIVLLKGTAKQRLATFAEHAYGEDPITKERVPRATFFVTNYESLIMGGHHEQDPKTRKRKKYIPGPLFQAMLDWKAEALVWDESHRLKSPSAIRSQLADKLSNPKGATKPLCYLLSGSPILKSPEDLFMPFKIMDGGKTFGENYFIFRAQYFEDENAWMLKSRKHAGRHFPKWVIKKGSAEQINQKIEKYSMRKKKEDCLDLPEEIDVTIKCGMTAEQARNYKEMKRDFVTTMQGGSSSATLSIVKGLRLMQITSGFLPLDSTGGEEDVAKIHYEKSPKDEALREKLEELTPEHKVIVWACWRENYGAIRKICEELGVKYVEIHGGVTRSKQDEAIKLFQTDPDVRVLIGHPFSGGIGVNLICAPYDITYSRNFSLEQWIQPRARNHRGGQTQKVTHYSLVVEDTIDELVVQRLSEKFEISEQILGEIALALQSQVG